jgi:trans-aconitate 2-methyltransferase
MWSPEQYRRFGDERSRAFFDLLARVPLDSARNVVDLGCGPGELTLALATRFEGANVIGVDNSREMIQAAKELGARPNVAFELADLATWKPASPVDLVFANASFHWVPEHGDLLARWIGDLAPDGAIAFQVPANYDAPSHTLLHRVRTSARWAAKLDDAAFRHVPVAEIGWYVRFFAERGFRVDAWETVYEHILPGEDAVLEWTSGTALRPVLARLDESERAAFKTEYGALLRQAYPRDAFGTVFPFRRLFVVAKR